MHMVELITIEELKYHPTHVSLIIFIIFNKLICIDSRGYNPNKNIDSSNQMSFNPITNLPMKDYKAQMLQKEQEIKENYMNQLQQNEQFNNMGMYQQMRNNQIDQKVPIEYNPYRQPNSIYQGRP